MKTMVRLKLVQWIILALPLVLIVSFLLIAAGLQINQWGINWVWGLFTLLLVAWRWLLGKWTQPIVKDLDSLVAEVTNQVGITPENISNVALNYDTTKQVELVLQNTLESAQNDLPIWEDWGTFWQRCQTLVIAIAKIHHPEVKYPLLNIYIPQAYNLIRGTVNDLDLWMEKLSPALNQVTVGQAYQGYEIYRKLEPSGRKLWQIWNWAQWLLNPAAALAKQVSHGYSEQANQQLLINLSQLLRQAALTNLARQAQILYSGTIPSTSTLATSTLDTSTVSLPKGKTQTLKEILETAEPVEKVAQKPVNILLVGRTGAGKSSLINTLFQRELAIVDIVPSTEEIRDYQWQTETGEILTLWDTPGYEQVKGGTLRQQVLSNANQADLLLLVTPALDAAVEMDLKFLQDLKTQVNDLPTIVIVSQVDRLRPIREWQPPYNWLGGTRAKEVAIREATQYRAELLQDFCEQVLPVVTEDTNTGRESWGIDALSLALMATIEPAKQLRLARFLRAQEALTFACVKIIEHYTFQMATTQGLTALLKSPVLKFISTLTTGSPTLAYLLAEQIPVEQLPLVIGKLQMAYDLFSLLGTNETKTRAFDLLSLWPLILNNSTAPDRNAWAFGHTLAEYWRQNFPLEQLQDRFAYYLGSYDQKGVN